MENEIWKDIPGYEGYYQVSNFGRVKSLRRVLKAGLRKGYLYISLRNKKFNIKCSNCIKGNTHSTIKYK